MTDGTTPYVRPDVAAFLAFLNAQDGPKMEDLPPAAAREVMRKMGQLSDVPRGDIAQVEDRTIPGPAGDIPTRLYNRHPGRQTGPVLVFFPASGWVIGALDPKDPYFPQAGRLTHLTAGQG